MRPNAIFIFLLLSAAVLFQAASAEEIIFSAKKPVFYSPPGEALLQLGVKNTFGEDISGSFTGTVHDPENPGNVQSFTDMRVIFKEQEILEFSVPQSGGNHYLIDLSFDYFDRDDPDVVYLVRLEGIQLCFTEDAEAQSRDSYGEPLKSVQTRITSGSLQQQGSVNSPGNEPSSRIKNSPEDMSSLSEFIEAERVSVSERKDHLVEVIGKSPVVQDLNAFLGSEGYNCSEPYVTVGDGFLNDEFAVSYSCENNSEIEFSGEIKEDKILFVTSESAGLIPLMDCVSGNETYCSLDSRLCNEGFSVTGSYLNITPEDTSVRIFYENGLQNREINISIINGAPVLVVLEENDGGIHFLIPVVIVFITAFSALIIYRAYRKYFTISAEDPDGDEVDFSGRISISPSELLEKSNTEFLNGKTKEAFSKAGRALRLWVSLNYSEGENLTNSQALLILKSGQDQDYELFSDILSICDSVVYGNKEPGDEVFRDKYMQIRKIIERENSLSYSGEK